MTSVEQAKSNESKDLEWMYSSADKSVDHEEYLLGRSVDSGVIPYDPQKNHVEHECIPPSLRDLQSVGDIEQVDAARKLQEDPLFEIHRREIEARKQALQNPVKLKKQLEVVKARRISSSSEDDLDRKLVAKLNKLKSNLAGDLNKSLRKSKKHKHKKKKKKHVSSSESDSDSDDEKKHKSKKSKSEKPDKNKKYSDSKSDMKNRKDRRKYSTDNSDKESRRKEHKKNNSEEKRKISKKRHSSDDESHVEIKRRKRSNSRELEKPHLMYKRSKSSSEDRELLRKNYGLVKADGSKIKQVINKPTEKVSKKSENKKKWVKPERRKLTEEEMDQKRREMMSNAEWRDHIRREMARKETSRDKVEPDFEAGAEFLKKQLLKNASYGSVEARIKSNINNIQRSGREMDRNFARRH